MTRANTQAQLPVGLDTVSSDALALASHMGDCDRSRGRLFRVHTLLDSIRSLALPRIVSTGALLAAAALCLLLVLT